MIIDDIPLRLPASKQKMKPLNLNQFRNNHFQINNKMKHQIHTIIQEKCRGLKKPKPPIELIFTLFRRDNRNIDLSNVLSIVDKFVTDGLVLSGVIPDDNIKFIQKVSYIDGGIDRANPRAMLEIKHYEGINEC